MSENMDPCHLMKIREDTSTWGTWPSNENTDTIRICISEDSLLEM